MTEDNPKFEFMKHAQECGAIFWCLHKSAPT
ncbi:hypothetical protein BRADI_4g31066v3 [Brachypodium distachyon]|uniref:Uncharacterized protein n=1 Tax=Brachypodium distachyon TaxID=15368 RepID=A0A2K2CRJ7_BRADI|nr:hypothetical protein BRADI_4g31066v3 [Brachypodium distachyon]